MFPGSTVGWVLPNIFGFGFIFVVMENFDALPIASKYIWAQSDASILAPEHIWAPSDASILPSFLDEA